MLGEYAESSCGARGFNGFAGAVGETAAGLKKSPVPSESLDRMDQDEQHCRTLFTPRCLILFILVILSILSKKSNAAARGWSCDVRSEFVRC